MLCRLILLSVLAIPALSQALSAKTPENEQEKQLCIDYQNELIALDKPALRERLREDPTKVAASLPEEEIAKIKRLIELDELLMFRCRIGLKPLLTADQNGLQNGIQRIAIVPDLPIRKPRIKRTSVAPRTIVPLPTRRSDAK